MTRRRAERLGRTPRNAKDDAILAATRVLILASIIQGDSPVIQQEENLVGIRFFNSFFFLFPFYFCVLRPPNRASVAQELTLDQLIDRNVQERCSRR